MTNKQYAEAAVAAAMSNQAEEAQNQFCGESEGDLLYAKRSRTDFVPIEGRVSPSVENAAEWLKRQRTEDAFPSTFTTTTRITPSLATPDPLVAPLHMAHMMNGSTEPGLLPSMEPLDASLATPLAYHQDPQVVAAAFAAAELFANSPSVTPHGILHAVTTSSPSSPMGAPYAGVGISSESTNVATPSSDEAVVAEVTRELQGMGADLAEAAANAADAVEAADDAQHHRVSLEDAFNSHHHALNMVDIEQGPSTEPINQSEL
jgi:hypothetical protein